MRCLKNSQADLDSILVKDDYLLDMWVCVVLYVVINVNVLR